jgi:hypothetical protein
MIMFISTVVSFEMELIGSWGGDSDVVTRCVELEMKLIGSRTTIDGETGHGTFSNR